MIASLGGFLGRKGDGEPGVNIYVLLNFSNLCCTLIPGLLRKMRVMDSRTGEGVGGEGRGLSALIGMLPTRSDGQEVHRLVWFEHERQDQIECLFEKILGILNQYDNTQLQQAAVAKLCKPPCNERMPSTFKFSGKAFD